MQTVIAEARQELTGHILPFWMGLADNARGGFIGRVDFDLTRHPEAAKGCILNSRILWFFSECYLALGDDRLRPFIGLAYDMLCRMTDNERGGVYWALNADGSVADADKHTYNQAFAIYALSACCRATGNAEALERAIALFRLVESKCRDEDGYLEAFTADFRPVSNEKLSTNGVIAERTMNTLLHVLEAYTGLYRAWPDADLRARIVDILGIWERRVFNPALRRQEVLFDRGYRSLVDMTSFGHDIETAWLMNETLEVLADSALTARIQPRLLAIAENVYARAMTDHGLANECVNGVIDTTRVWWVQAEALMGFLFMWEQTGETRWLDAVRALWRYIRGHIVDPRPGGEWFWYVSEDGTPGADRAVADPWKCPYHNGRMALELIKRGRSNG